MSSKSLSDFGFPDEYSPTIKSDVLDFILNHRKDRNGKIFANFKIFFPELYGDMLTWNFPDTFKFTQKVYHYLKDDVDLKLGLCKICGRRCKFDSVFRKGYGIYCCKGCFLKDQETINEKKRKTCLEHFGVSCSLSSPEIQEKISQTNLERYGFKYVSQSPEIKEKIRQTNLERFGVEYPFQSPEIQEKIRHANLENYNVENVFQSPEIQEKIRRTNLKKYGAERYSQTDEFKERFKQTNLERIGHENPARSDEIQEKTRQTNLERLGVEYPMMSRLVQEKSKETIKERYGFDNVSQVPEIQEKTRRTNLKKYGDVYYSKSDEYRKRLDEINKKSHQTKKKNGSCNSSKIEEDLYNWFTSNNINLIRQYRSELYPYACDFYLPDYDLYIEIQGHWTHGGHPFEPTNPDDQKKLEVWKSKTVGGNHNQYYVAIKVWTMSDPKKRKTASENKLNYLEIFSNDISETADIIHKYLIKI